MSLIASACPLDCPDSCSLEVDVRDGRVANVDGSSGHPFTAGFICGKVRKIASHLYGDERLRYPMLRDGARGSGSFRRVSWDEALDVIVTRTRAIVAEHGGEAILPFYYGGSNGLLTQGSADARLFRRLGASQLLRTFCGATSAAAQTGLYGTMPGVALQDYVHARLIVLWAVNPSATGIHLVPVIKEARRRGAKLVVVDPRRIPLAGSADLHLPIRPGTDLPVALALIHWLFDNRAADSDFLARHATGVETLRQRAAEWPIARAAEVAGVPAGDLERFAKMYAESAPAVIRCGWGQERNRNGGSSTAAILSLPAVAGKFAVRGGGFTLSSSSAWRLNSSAAVAEPVPQTRSVNMNQLGRALIELSDPPIAMLFVYNCNPVATAPAQNAVLAGLAREDLFTVVFDQVHTDTADHADVILPATTFLEHRELRCSYGSLEVFDAAPAIPPVGEARPNYEVFAELCRRLDLERPGDPVTGDEIVAAILRESPRGAALAQTLAAEGRAGMPGGAGMPGEDRPIPFVDAFPGTPDQKIHLAAEHLDRESPRGLYGYADDPATPAHPLTLISPSLARTVSSTFGQLIRGQVPVAIHPRDAAARGIAGGDRVRVFNDRGEILCRARLSQDLRPGVALMPKGLWRRHTENRATSNAVVPDSLSDLAGGACYNDARVQIERFEPDATDNDGASRRPGVLISSG